MPLKAAWCMLIIEYEQSAAGQVWVKRVCVWGYTSCSSTMFQVIIQYRVTSSWISGSLSICVHTYMIECAFAWPPALLKPPWHHSVCFSCCMCKTMQRVEIEPFSLIYHQTLLSLSARQRCIFFMLGIWNKMLGCDDTLTGFVKKVSL